MTKAEPATYRYGKSSQGFTLVELMVALVISIFVSAAIWAAYTTQQRSYIVQEQVAEMQQNIRAAMYMIVGEMRMAGYDPRNTAGAAITTAQPGQISFTQDANNDGATSAGEMIEFGFSVADDVDRNGIPDIDVNGDGVPDARQLGRQAGGGGGYQAIAENIQAIEFVYLDAAGAVTATLGNIRAVQISILARAGDPDLNFFNTEGYLPASNVTLGTIWGPYNDNFRRRLLITTVQCRNIGI